MAIPQLTDYEVQMDDDGFVLNTDFSGTLPFVDITKISGLDSAPSRTTLHDHEGVDGGYVDSQFMTTRTVILEGIAYVDPSDPESLCDTLKYNFRPSKSSRPFYFKVPNHAVRMVRGKAQGVRYDIDTARRTGKTNIQATILCADPYIYDASPTVAAGYTGAPDTGFGFNLAFNFGFGGAGTTSNQITLSNSGNHDAYPIIDVTGPISVPSLIESNTGKSLAFNLTLTSTDVLEIDTRKHTILLNGQSRRNSLVTGSQWFYTPAGVISTISLLGSLASATGTMTANGAGTVSTIVGTDADAADINIGDRFRLYASTGGLKEPTVFQVTSKSSVSGNTTVGFTPNAVATTATNDFIKAGVASFTGTLNSTWY